MFTIEDTTGEARPLYVLTLDIDCSSAGGSEPNGCPVASVRPKAVTIRDIVPSGDIWWGMDDEDDEDEESGEEEEGFVEIDE